ncbi:DUF2079 domain-containing protein [Candidatus Gracilibacteria bacterium]|nr:DUF2079 domain-containing protein [Candidatus Gracilibacteria bacterium]
MRALVVFVPMLPLLSGSMVRLLPGLTVAGAALLSSSPDGGSIRSAHYGLLVPFLIWAAAGAQSRKPRTANQKADIRQGLPLRLRVLASGMLCVAISGFLMLTLVQYEIGSTTEPPRDWMLRSERDKLRDAWLRTVPPEVPVAASLFLTPRLLQRETIFLARFPAFIAVPEGHEERNLAQVQYVVADALFDYRLDQWGFELPLIERLLQNSDFDLIEQRDGLLLFAREALHHRALPQQARMLDRSSEIVQTSFDGQIGLLESSVERIAGRRYRARFVWTALHDQQQKPRLLAVSQLDGVALSRIVHLPTLGLLPTTQWSQGTVVEERFEFEVAAELAPGSYPLVVAWYDSSVVGMALGGTIGRLGEELVVATLAIE